MCSHRQPGCAAHPGSGPPPVSHKRCCAGAPDDIKRTQLQLQKSFMFTGTLTPLGMHDYEATALYPDDHHYTPIARYIYAFFADECSSMCVLGTQQDNAHWSHSLL